MSAAHKITARGYRITARAIIIACKAMPEVGWAESETKNGA
jgi:hypothetical protein